MSDEQPREINKWDGPSKEDFFGREPFVETIVKTIQTSKEGFNLGISARWGEGKSSILEQLQPKLEALNYKVLTFQPWKYTQDETSIKRKFIIDIYSQLGEEYDDTELYSSSERDRELNPDDYQKWFMSRLGVFAKLFGLTALGFLGLLLFFQWFTGIDINVTQIFLTNLFIPILAGIAPLIAKIAEITVKQVTPKIESAEQFEKRFNDVIKKIMESEDPSKRPERIVIFVDDLDRCNHTEVEQVLTALFTFFNNKYCTYIITADHTVIRRYISKFLQLEDVLDDDGNVDLEKTNELRQKEATEYLKKIFQINFILPRIPNDLLEQWTKEILDATPIIASKNPYGRDYLVNLILNNFNGNPRKIKHFIRTLAFQIDAIGEKISRLVDSNSDEGKNLTKVKESPELLAKILVLQDRFPDFYEQLMLEPKVLKTHEEGALAKDKELQNLLAQEPKFFNSVTRVGQLKTIDPYYFLYFSGSTGFVETKVVDPMEVKALARSAEFDGLTKIISGLTDEPRNAQIEHIKSEYETPQIQPPEKVNVIRSLFHVVSLVEEPSLRLQKLKDILDAKAKYSTEFESLQSVDFEKFITFADIDVVGRLLGEPPFTVEAIQGHLLNAFISKQGEIGKGEIADKFIETISGGITKNDANSIKFLSLAKQLSPENIGGSETLQSALIETYKIASASLKQEILISLLEIRGHLTPSKVSEFEDAVAKVVTDGSINDAVGVFSNVPTKINKDNFNFSTLRSAACTRISKTSASEFEQIANTLLHPAVKDAFDKQDVDKILLTIVENLKPGDPGKKIYVESKLPDIVVFSDDKMVLLKKVVSYIESGSAEESAPILNTLQFMTDFWSANPNLKKQFANELKESSRKTKKELKELMVKLANELDPPPPPRQKKSSKA